MNWSDEDSLAAFPLPLAFNPLKEKFAVRSLLPATSTGWQIETGFVRTLSYLEDGTIVVKPKQVRTFPEYALN